MKPYTAEDPIAALATPWGVSAIAVIRTSGPGTLKRLSPFFKGAQELTTCAPHTLQHGLLTDGRQPLDDIMLGVFHAPHSYTGEEAVEIYCHGGLAIIRQILDLLLKNGFRQANPGEFTLRAFLNHKIDLTRAEAVQELIQAQTDKGRALALSRLTGSIARKIAGFRERLVSISAALEVHIDYPDEELPEDIISLPDLTALEEELTALLATYQAGKIYQEGVTVTIAGCTNAGKSTLFNLLLKEERAIVSEQPGTTRDYLEGLIDLDGIPVRLFDTAGIRQADNRIEQEGIKRTNQLLKNSQVILYLVDAATGLTREDEALLAGYKLLSNTQLIPVWNKVDAVSEKTQTARLPAGFIPLSAATGYGSDLLYQELKKALFRTTSTETSAAVIDSARQKTELERCLQAVRNFHHGLKENLPLDVLGVELKEALDALGELTGEVTTTEILDKIFSNFCVGK